MEMNRPYFIRIIHFRCSLLSQHDSMSNETICNNHTMMSIAQYTTIAGGITGLALGSMAFVFVKNNRTFHPHLKVSIMALLIGLLLSSTILSVNSAEMSTMSPGCREMETQKGAVCVRHKLLPMTMIAPSTTSLLLLNGERMVALFITRYDWVIDGRVVAVTASAPILMLIAEVVYFFVFAQEDGYLACSWHNVIRAATPIQIIWLTSIGLLVLSILLLAAATFKRYRAIRHYHKFIRAKLMERIYSAIYPFAITSAFLLYSTSTCVATFYFQDSIYSELAAKASHILHILIQPSIVVLARPKILSQKDFSLWDFCVCDGQWLKRIDSKKWAHSVRQQTVAAVGCSKGQSQ
ncbi:hypothetical protein QR680_001042 [Steinernema hermaphroditum]|uniref:Uncharacterized protein n=1 Tax=Steinernema hermaphroditum TaxID=289476 RepID=A0AA39LER0_9BILA|nr:hypothetical protein QR680_001042 [Steinernema hermaphroditum]